MKKIIFISIGGLGFFAIVAGFVLHMNLIKLPITRVVDVQFVAGLDNDRALVGFAHNMFVGKVMQQIGYIQTADGPVTQFEIAIVSNIKGELNGTVIVNQDGGYKNGVLYKFEGEQLLTPGSTYLLTTRYYDNQNWISTVPNGSKIMSEDKNASTADLQALAQTDERMRQLQQAYKNEILFDDDVKNGNTRNSYQSLQEK